MKEKIRETVREIIDNEVKTPSVGYFWKGLALFLLGIIIGFTFAPIKKGIKIGCDNGNNCIEGGNLTEPCCKNKQEDKNEEEEECCGNFCGD
ncbi:MULTISPECIES: hypothetical protein [Ruminococcus]|uniref:Uncharacterized protein n=1 Tax=Ruminococcus albus (strain ATCC 27210 / DSM 20455 / JCM 14654 / NCDO 2250 / 7) TaxID=697329 RepID=E6UFN3_RUMA7|nr:MULTISPECIES: hypothetical protein [Ruminococcus]ADU23022.1 hypothetical protein Rumal_2547 [Ruminococcus albus 7 = DSM 20455]MCR5020917.1 hypothetical protein [Ruminococcus sp.]